MNTTHRLNRKTLMARAAQIALAALLCLSVLPVFPVRAQSAAPTAVEITSLAPNPAYIEQPVTVSVRATSAAGVPRGRVEVRTGQDRVCTITLNTAGEGSCTLSFEQAGAIRLKAFYLGTDAFLPSASAEKELAVMDRFIPVIEITDEPDPSVAGRPFDVRVQVSAVDGPLATGPVSVWLSAEKCSEPPAVLPPDSCEISLSGGTGSCTLTPQTPVDGYICAAYEGSAAYLSGVAEGEPHLVSASNTFVFLTRLDPEPSLLGEQVWAYFEVESPDGEPAASDRVTVTSGGLSCTATVGEGRCALVFNTPHLHQVTASYHGGTYQPAGSDEPVALESATSRPYTHRVNAPPTSIRLSATGLSVFTAVGERVATITATDPNPDETIQFSLVNGQGSDHNAFFLVEGDQLILARSVSGQGNSLKIRLRATDEAGLTYEQSFTLFLNGEAVLPDTGFPAGRVTQLPLQPKEKAYQQLNEVVLEIPSLGVSAPITGVPNLELTWDATWLSNQVGWLHGTAFPGWEGNSALAAHSTLASGLPGPFARLRELRKGDQIWVRAFGETHIYEVRSVTLASPEKSDVLRHEDSAWLTLVTCQSYDEETGTYRWRLVVRAERVDIR